MARANRYAGLNWYGVWTTATGTTELLGDFRVFTWNKGGQYFDATAGADGAVNEKIIRDDDSFSLTLMATAAGSVLPNTEMKQGTEGTLLFSTGEGTADGKSKYTVEAMARDSSIPENYAAGTEWTLNWRGLGVVAVGAWSSGA